jgi:hypothetical protein
MCALSFLKKRVMIRNAKTYAVQKLTVANQIRTPKIFFIKEKCIKGD